MKKIALTLIAVVVCSFFLTGTAIADDKLMSLIDQMADYQVTEECASALGLSAGTVGFSLLEAVVDPDATQGCQTRSPVGPFDHEDACKASQASASDPKTGCYYKNGKYYYDMILTVPCEKKCQERSQVGPFDNEEACQASQASASDPKTGCYYQGGKYYYDVILTVACDETNPDEVPPTPTDGFF